MKGLSKGLLTIQRIVFGKNKSTDAVLAKSESADSQIDLTGRLNISEELIQTTPEGAQWIRGYASEEITLADDAAATDSTADLLPANSIIEAVAWRVTELIDGDPTPVTEFSIGDANEAARFQAAQGDLAAGDTGVGLAHQDPTVAAADLGPVQAAAAKVRVTCDANATESGKVRVTVFYRRFVAPTS